MRANCTSAGPPSASASATPRAIQQLERRLGVTLLERNRCCASLTGACEILLQEGRATLDATAAAPAAAWPGSVQSASRP
ncbi:LysR family transcriptional regulator [Actinokineospora terrae]|uniref:HTH lysR-type domain-containing protein n=1 Tax=Actinokineospora terrae TaxID=155974 RepID=A0A1H9X8C4_9PSEU|nr:LysR family transcriptional regulator [Actinokineospora terrae]SES42321.1 hypothetical protein SAMN04487818_113125 [Actinokineospora terrae]